MSKEWDLNNDEHLRELVHALIINATDKTASLSSSKLNSYKQQYFEKQKDVLAKLAVEDDESEMPLLIGDHVICKYTSYKHDNVPVRQRDRVSAFLTDGKRMILTNGNVVNIDDFELDRHIFKEDETPVPKKYKIEDYVPKEFIEETAFEKCKRLELALQTTVAWFLTKISDREHFKQWDREKTSINGIPCIYPKDH